ncbi:MAG: DnaJ domain-containing protein [Nitrospirota bacterium]
MDDAKKITDQKRKLTQKIMLLRIGIEQDIIYAFEKHFENDSYVYLAFEQKMTSITGLLEIIQNQIVETTRLFELGKIAERLGYVEERIDETVSPLYNRRRKSRRFRFSDFFNKYKEQMGGGAESEVGSLKEAFDLLGLSGNEDMLVVTTTFRRLAKKYHPDARGGDRSYEIELRKIVGAYQLIKQNHHTTR